MLDQHSQKWGKRNGASHTSTFWFFYDAMLQRRSVPMVTNKNWTLTLAAAEPAALLSRYQITSQISFRLCNSTYLTGKSAEKISLTLTVQYNYGTHKCCVCARVCIQTRTFYRESTCTGLFSKAAKSHLWHQNRDCKLVLSVRIIYLQ